MTQDLNNLVDFENGRQSKRIFHDREIYDLEMERIFGKCWIYLAHESQIPKPGDFLRTFMGEDEVLVIRQRDQSIQAFLNVCKHRGNRVCKADFGNQRQFTCNYHGWSYGINGALVGVPLEDKAYYGHIDKAPLGLKAVTQVANYKGLVFGNFDPNAPSLEDYLGDVKWYLDVVLDAMPGGMQLLGNVQKVEIGANWKLPVENVSGDGYHAGWAHAGAMSVTQSLQVGGLTAGNTDVDAASGMSVAGLNGHAVLASTDGEAGAGYAFYPDPAPALQYLRENRDHAITRLGEYRGRKLWGSQQNITIYPNLNILPGLNWLRIYHPKGLNKYEQWSWAFGEAAMPEELKQMILENQNRTFGPSGIFDNDDGDNFEGITEMGRGSQGRETDIHLNMALRREHIRPGIPGIISDGMVCEQNQRWMYRRWLDLMQAETWNEVPNYDQEIARLREKTENRKGVT